VVLTFFAKNYNESNEETKMIIVKDVVDANTICINCDSGNSCGSDGEDTNTCGGSVSH
jgi:hypothetical protein